MPAVVAELIARARSRLAPTVNGKSLVENCEGEIRETATSSRPIDAPDAGSAGFINLKGNLFDSAIMKTRVISDEFRQRYLSTLR